MYILRLKSDIENWKIYDFEPFLNQSEEGAAIVRELAKGVPLSNVHRYALVQLIIGFDPNMLFCKKT